VPPASLEAKNEAAFAFIEIASFFAAICHRHNLGFAKKILVGSRHAHSLPCGDSSSIYKV